MQPERARTLPSAAFDRGPGGGEAPAWHLVALVLVILLVAVTGSVFATGLPVEDPRSRIVSEYVPMVVVAWGLVAYVAFASPSEPVVGRLLGNRDPSRLAADVALALVLVAMITAVESTLAPHADATRESVLRALLPHTLRERLAWIGVATSVGFSEELVYRGYLRSRFEALSASPTIGILVQATLFGFAHAQQGMGAMARAALYGAVLGGVTRWRKSLRPAIGCHVALDLISGLAR